MRTSPVLTFENTFSFCMSFPASWINAISLSGTPSVTSFFLMSSYMLNSDFPLGVDISEKTSCANFFSLVFSHISKIFLTHIFTLLSGLSGSIGLISLWSSASFLPSLVILNILSILGSISPPLTLSALSESAFSISFCSGVGFVLITS